MELQWLVSQPITHATSQTTFTVQAGKSLKIETSPQGEEILDAECPAGKTWTVHLSLFIVEE